MTIKENPHLNNRNYKGIAIVLVRLLVAFLFLYFIYTNLQTYVGNAYASIFIFQENSMYYDRDLIVFFRSWNEHSAWIVTHILNIFGVQTTLNDDRFKFTLASGIVHRVIIGWECNFLLPVFSYIALIVAVPRIYLKKRLLGLGIGLILLYMGNIMRMVSLVLIGVHFGYQTMEHYHIDMFDTGMELLNFAIYILWAGVIVGFSQIEDSLTKSEWIDLLS